MRGSILILILVGMLLVPPRSQAQGRAAIVREAAEYVLRRFGKEAVEEGLEGFARKIEVLAVKHGDEAITAVRKVGPSTFRLVEEAGEHGLEAVKIMAKHGDDAVWVVAKKNRMAIFVKYGDNAGDSMIRHGELAEPLLEAIGRPAAEALTSVSAQNGRRLAMMQADGEFARIGRTAELLKVVGRYGDSAMDFIWKHKGALAISATLVAFLADPEPFINGTSDITKVVTENVVKPAVVASGQIMADSARSINWTFIALCILCLACCMHGLRLMRRRVAT